MLRFSVVWWKPTMRFIVNIGWLQLYLFVFIHYWVCSQILMLYGIVIIWVWVAVIPWGGTQLWVTHHVPPKRPYFFSLAFTERPPFSPTFTQWPLFLTNSLSLKDPDTSLSLKDPSFSHLIVKQVTIFGKKKIGIFENFDKFDEMLRNFWPFWPWKPLFWMHFTERPPIFVGFVTERPLHLRCLVALVRHFYMWVPSPPPRIPWPMVCSWFVFSCNTPW